MSIDQHFSPTARFDQRVVDLFLESVTGSTETMVRHVRDSTPGTGWAELEVLLPDGGHRRVRADARWVLQNEIRPGDITWIRHRG